MSESGWDREVLREFVARLSDEIDRIAVSIRAHGEHRRVQDAEGEHCHPRCAACWAERPYHTAALAADAVRAVRERRAAREGIDVTGKRWLRVTDDALLQCWEALLVRRRWYATRGRPLPPKLAAAVRELAAAGLFGEEGLE